MGRRIRWLGVIMVVCLGLVVAQLVNIQLVKAKQLQTSPNNPEVAAQKYVNPRGMILAADGTVLARSVPTPAGTNQSEYPYDYVRQYPQGPLYAGITGYDSALYYGTAGIEEQYDSFLGPHQQPPQTLSQLIFRQSQPTITDNVTLTVEPALQQAAWYASDVDGWEQRRRGRGPPAAKTGTFWPWSRTPPSTPTPLVSTSLSSEQLAYFSYIQKDHEGFYPLRPIATEEYFSPGSTMKVVTSTAAYNLKPSLAGFDYPVQACQTFSDSNKPLCDESGPCGGTMTQMLPFSCDPGYGELGVQLGVSTLRQQANLFGYNSVPSIDLPNVIASPLTTLPDNSQAFQAYTAIGQDYVKDTALQNAMVAAGIANGGVVMTPHLMSSIHDSQGALVQSYTPKPESTAATAQAAQAVTALMEGVVTSGTASGVGFPPYLCAAVKTGTAQTSAVVGVNHDLDDWLGPGQQPPDRRGGRRAGSEHLIRRCRHRGADHERGDGGRAATERRSASPVPSRRPRCRPSPRRPEASGRQRLTWDTTSGEGRAVEPAAGGGPAASAL